MEIGQVRVNPTAMDSVPENALLQITLVAQVITIDHQATNTVYWLDDGSGRIEGRHWVDSSSEEDSKKWAGIS
jgi:replication factor A2